MKRKPPKPHTPVLNDRRGFLRTLAWGSTLGLPWACHTAGTEKPNKTKPMTQSPPIEPSDGEFRMPVLFVGHGSPMNVIEDNQWSRGFSSLRHPVRKPKAILSISAHWYTDGTYVTGNAQPEIVYDFSGFPPALYEIKYKTAGNVDLAERVRSLLGQERASLNTQWGIDHGTWSVLRFMYPEADVPVIQLSIDKRLSAAQHYQLGRSLAPLRDEQVLIMGSGNVVHNLRDAFQRMHSRSAETPAWAASFDESVKQILSQHDGGALQKLHLSDDGRMAHPTPDHWIPLLYAQAASDANDAVNFPTEGFDLGSISMRNIKFG
jgi:4,5-DOPA dioxygenase extradiol